MEFTFTYSTPIGSIQMTANEVAITRLTWIISKEIEKSTMERETALMKEAYIQLIQYFRGIRTSFSIPLAPSGTPFQQKVWQALLQIPYGQTRSYQQIAETIGHPKAYRAVGMANHQNPIGIFIPCHRVVGKNGSLTGFSGGIHLKQWLLTLEKGEKYAD